MTISDTPDSKLLSVFETNAPVVNRHYIWLPQLRMTYVRVPKAANSSIRALLLKHLDLDDETRAGKSNSDKYWAELPPEQAISMTKAQFRAHPEACKNWSFTFVREPFARLYSCWNNKVIENTDLSRRFKDMGVSQGMPFEEFAAAVARSPDSECDIHVRSQADILTVKGKIVPKYVGKVESIDEDWKKVRSRTKRDAEIRLGSVPEKNVRGKSAPEISESFSPELRRLVFVRYEQDYRIFYPERIAALVGDGMAETTQATPLAES